MPMNKTPSIPSKVRRAVLAHNAHMCCVCHARGVGVQIHHIDKNPRNNRVTNLAVLCVTDHDAHHRPNAYQTVNHLNMSKAGIQAAKWKWEWFVAETKRSHPRIMTTITAYGTVDHIHAMRVVYQGRDQTIYLDRVFHELNAPLDKWIDAMLAESLAFNRDIPIAVIDAPMPVEYCPCRRSSTSRTVVSSHFDRIMKTMSKGK